MAKTVGSNPLDNHWAIREHAARLIAQICHRFGDVYENLQPRISKTYYQAFTDPEMPPTTNYGAIIGILDEFISLL